MDSMRKEIWKWMIIGGIAGASANLILGSNTGMRRKWMKNGKNMLRSTGKAISGIIDMFS